ncbi:class II fumarate hydratase [Aliiglaciecola sp. CAU 1673]|uniref:class II fumarate hydratase n=1 Tax=Aliiglaciecola sp. CAU 1673 TaxID=3032595 RepID=UPI0023DBDE01|nr:class II fumarate hydratase [Aliiglaciecola sp. CAU 1673]MDF2180052.1 class II fumarate hydratase [Aliiglaciecola sp. CAU 1673]
MTQYRIEKDSMGEIKVPTQALYQAQTQRALDNFQFAGRPLPISFHHAILEIKSAAARANLRLGKLDNAKTEAILSAVDLLLTGKHDDQFCVDIYQTGSGTSSNMNVNEVIATVANRQAAVKVHANDDVNCSQSSNDVIPSALQLSAAKLLNKKLLPALYAMEKILRSKAKSLKEVIKTGRTHLMDAMPITLQQEIECWIWQLNENRVRLEHSIEELCELPIGGTAVGTGVNCPPEFDHQVCEHLAQVTGLPVVPCLNKFSRIASQDVSVNLSGQLNTLAVTVMKIANDLRWMNSGPLAGLSEVRLQPLQPGSSIMPGKVNPVIPEALAMIGAKVMGNHQTISLAGQSGNFQLNVMLPVMAECLLESLNLLANGLPALAECIANFEVNHQQLEVALSRNPILVTALNEKVGYEQAAKIAKAAYEQGKPVIEVAKQMTDLDEEKLKALLDPSKLTNAQG